jgi:uncharacterized SAM-binding protein YcdF (DUF218 family)
LCEIIAYAIKKVIMAAHKPAEAIIVLGFDLTSKEKLARRAVARLDIAHELWKNKAAPKIVVSGRHSLSKPKIPSRTQAEVMKKYLVKKDVPADDILLEDLSLDTIGNAYFTKIKVVIPNKWEKIIVVTSETHLPRAEETFGHIYGPDFDIQAVAAPEVNRLDQRGYELLGYTLLEEVLGNTSPGDHDAIGERLFDTVPQYKQLFAVDSTSEAGVRLSGDPELLRSAA